MSEKNMSDEILSLEGLVFEAIELEIKDHIDHLSQPPGSQECYQRDHGR